MEQKEVICLQCPFACKILVSIDDHEHIVAFANNRCDKGKAYATQEITHPVRVLTSTVKLETKDIEHPILPVQTSAPIPKSMLFDAMQVISNIEVKTPVYYKQVVYPNILDTGADVISTFEVLE